MKTSSLAAAFLATTYRVDAGGEVFALRIGVPDPAFGCWLRKERVSCWGIVTACNPGGRLTPADNATRTDELRRRIVRLGWRHVPSCNVADAADWPDEPGFCVLDVGAAQLRMLAAVFGQSAIVFGEDGEGGRLIWLEDR